MMFGLCLSWRGSCFLKTSWSYILDLNLSTERLTSNKAFTNKLWNAGKFLLQNLPSQSDLSAWEALPAFKKEGNIYNKQVMAYQVKWTLLSPSVILSLSLYGEGVLPSESECQKNIPHGLPFTLHPNV
ncbi:Valine--tRNA ligase [Forsythia ovata]|uniref:Valine--tRNA ligase n=1 Tax=Forsythia ovata TaxID=205694 RepID=A0ABD1UZM5_9LAMI